MFKLIARIILAFTFNIVAFIGASYYIPGFDIDLSPISLATVAAIFTALNLFLKPILKLFFGPVIILTFGIGALGLNTIMLYILDFFSDYVTINGLQSLIYATFAIGMVNIVLTFTAKKLYHE